MEALLKYKESLENDGYIGISVDAYTYYSGTPTQNTPVVIYVINTNTKRVGRGSDRDIISELVNEKGFIVIVLDYKGNPKSCCPGLDWSIQGIRSKIDNEGLFLNGTEHKKKYTYVLPAGYSITLDEYYWSIDRPGSDGAIDKIVEIWNNDFCGVKGHKTVTYPDGTEKLVRDIEAKSIFDCVKKDGSPIELDLKMDIMYPVDPEERVPVMVYYSSSEIRVGSWTAEDRPHMTGYLFSGYGGAIFDYGYTPMARVDHYGYFDGNGTFQGSVSGDNYTYSADVFSGIKNITAAIRKLRYLADTQGDKYHFDVDRFGAFGNSKGGLCTRLGHPHPETLADQRWFPHHHGETRFDNGDTKDVTIITEHGTEYTLHGGEPQPWLKYSDGREIPSNVQFVYANCGGGLENIKEGHAPTFASGSMKDNSYGAFFTGVVNHCRTYDVPLMYLSMSELAHSLVSGRDRDYGIDGYQALFHMSDYYLKNDGAVCEYIDFKEERLPQITVRLSGSVSPLEIEKTEIRYSNSNEEVEGSWRSEYGRTSWIFTPNSLKPNSEITVYLPDTIVCENGSPVKGEKSAVFKTADKNILPVAVKKVKGGAYVLYDTCVSQISFSVDNDASNRLLIYALTHINEEDISLSDIGEKLCEQAIVGEGRYKINAEGRGFFIKEKKEAGIRTLACYDFEDGVMPENMSVKPLACSDISDSISRNGKENKSLEIKYFREFDRFMPYHSFHFNHNSIGSVFIKDTPLTEEDMGRRFNVSFSVYDTDSRLFRAYVCPWMNSNYDIIDFNAKLIAQDTVAGQWCDHVLNWRVDDKNYIISDQRELEFICETRTEEQNKPIYMDNIKIEEIVTGVDISFR